MDLNDNSAVSKPSPNRADATIAGAFPAEAATDGETKAHVNGGTNGHLNGREFGMHELLHALQAMRIGDFSVRLPTDQTGLEGKIADTFNEIAAANERMASELEHVGQVVGREGKTRTRVQVRPAERFRGARWRPRSTT